MNELKPCPFCGSWAAFVETKHKKYPFMIKCMNGNCAARTDRTQEREYAIKLWNRRKDEEDA